MKVNFGLYQLDIFNIPSWVSFGHFYASFRKCLVWYAMHLGKNISKFVFENSRFQRVDAFQSLLCAGQRLWYCLYFFEINRKRTTGNFVIFILLHWYCHRGFGCGKMITFTLKIFNIFEGVYTRDWAISLCQRDASTQVVMSHNYSTQVFGFILFIPLVTKWHDRHRHMSIHHVPYLMSLSSPQHCSKTLTNSSYFIHLLWRVVNGHFGLWYV